MLWNLLFALCLSGVLRYGEYITDICPQGGYACPTTCDVDHKHHPRKECKDAKGNRNIWKKGWKTSKENEKDTNKKEDKKIEECNGKAKQDSRPDTTAI
tara:strand:+ start:566 stop:862 length:297 start_codon:yes stop_codon:yes gene_type:complete